MPAIIGPVEIVNVSGEGIVHFGDTFYTSPKVAAKTNAGCGGFNTGGMIVSNNGLSGTNVVKPDVIDQPFIGNN